MLTKEECLRFEEEDSSIEIRNTPENVKRVRELVKAYGFLKEGRSVGRGGIMSYYFHSKNEDLRFNIQWVYRMNNEFCFSPMRNTSELGCDLESGRFERVLKVLAS